MNKIIDSPVSYWGSKRRLLKQLLPLFPKDIETFYDLFCGSLSVSLNVNAKKIIANDLDKNIYNILRLIQDDKNLYEKIKNRIWKNSPTHNFQNVGMVVAGNWSKYLDKINHFKTEITSEKQIILL